MNIMNLGAIATPVTPPRFNPFQVGHDIYSTYFKWNGNQIDDHNGLREGKIYRVVTADIHSCSTELTVQEIDTGMTLPYEYNSVLFTPLPGYIGYSSEFPVIGQRYHLIQLNIANNSFDRRTTSAVQGLERIADKTYNVITRNSVYTVYVV